MGAVSSMSHKGFRRVAPVRSPMLALRRHPPSATAHSPQNPSLRLSVAGKRNCVKKNLSRPQVFDRAHRLHPPVPLLAARQAPRKNLPSVPKEYFFAFLRENLPPPFSERVFSLRCLPAGSALPGTCTAFRALPERSASTPLRQSLQQCEVRQCREQRGFYKQFKHSKSCTS